MSNFKIKTASFHLGTVSKRKLLIKKAVKKWYNSCEYSKDKN